MKTDKKPKRWLSWARDVAIALLVVFLFQWWQTKDIVSGIAPPLSGSLLNGQKVSLADYKGKPLLVHFWATWCPVCRTEDGSIDNLADDHQVLTVATNSGAAKEIERYLVQNKLDFPVLLDEDGELGGLWGIKGVPSSFILDSNGNIYSVTVGYTTEIGLRIRMWLAGR